MSTRLDEIRADLEDYLATHIPDKMTQDIHYLLARVERLEEALRKALKAAQYVVSQAHKHDLLGVALDTDLYWRLITNPRKALEPDNG